MRRYLAHEGKLGTCPEWYGKAQAAKWLGVPVPEVVNVPIWWVDKALKALTAENQAQQIIAERNK